MKQAAAIAVAGSLLTLIGQSPQPGATVPTAGASDAPDHGSAVYADAARVPASDLTDVVERYCQNCHNQRRLRGNLSLEGFDVEGAATEAATAERMIRKLRADMMPPTGGAASGGRHAGRPGRNARRVDRRIGDVSAR